MNINGYLDYRKAIQDIENPGSIVVCFKWGLEYLDCQVAKRNGGFEFTDYSLVVLGDWKRYVSNLVKHSLLSLDAERLQWGELDEYFIYDPCWTENELEIQTEQLLDRKIEHYLRKPGKPKPCVFGVDYKLEDLVRVIVNKLNED